MVYTRFGSKLFLFLACLLGCGVSASAAASDIRQFMESRDTVLQEFKHQADCKDGSLFNEEALKERQHDAIQSLGKQLRALIGDVRITGIKGKGLYTRTTVMPTECDHGFEFSRTDGMMYAGGTGRLFITLPAVQTWNSPSELFSPDAAWKKYMDIPLKSRDKAISVNASLGMFAQDSGPFPPTVALIEVEMDDRVLLYKYDGNGTSADILEQIAVCEKQYSKIFRREDASNQMEADHAYRTCYSKHIKSRAQYKTLVEKLQAIADHLQRAVFDHVTWTHE